MALFGELMLCAAAVLSAAAFALCLAGRERASLLAAGRALLLSAAGASAAALVALAFLLVVRDYRVAYVRDYADGTMSLPYLLAAIWGGQQGSLMLWAALQTWFTAAYAASSGGERRGFPLALAILAGLGACFLLLVLFESDPFAPLGTTATAGVGLNPLLRNPYMVLHPPALFLGFVGFSVPLARALASLAEGEADGWAAEQRPWILAAWIALTAGNVLGMVWAYEELGWGGYWGWDPVENASLLPWLTGTALVHSALAEARLGAHRRWNVALVGLTFALILFGTFLTRSGVIDSVHAFAGATVGPYLLALIAAVAIATAALLALRWRALAPPAGDAAPPLRLALLGANAWLLLAATAFVAIATTMPLISALLAGEEVALTPPFYNRWMVPIGLALLGLLGLCAALGWSAERGAAALLRRLGTPLGLGAIAAALAGATVGVRDGLGPAMRFAPLVAAGLLAFAGAAVAGALRRAILRGGRGGGARSRGRRKLGAAVAHAAVVVLFLGFAGAGFSAEGRALLRPGERLEVAGYGIGFLGLREDRDVEREAVFADLDVRGPDGAVGIRSPARFLYLSHPGRPTAEVAIERGLGEDLFLVLGETDEESGAAVIRAVVNPLVAWVWIGSVLLALGAIVAAARPGWLADLLEMRPETRTRIAPAAIGLALFACAALAAAIPLGAAGAIAVAGAFALAFALRQLAAGLRAALDRGGRT